MTTPLKLAPHRVAIVTGAASGLGRSIALRLAQDGHDIAVTDLPGSRVQEVAHEIEALGRRSMVLYTDLTKEDEVKKMVDDVAHQLGSVDIMVANAGIHKPGTVLNARLEDYEKIMSINATAVFLCYQYAALQMVEQGRGGRIIGASSQSGKVADSAALAYCASKFAVRGMTQSAALELAKYQITVNGYAPGPIETPMMRGALDAKVWEESKILAGIPVGRLGVPDEVAGYVSWLASESAAFVTGQTLYINGGQHLD
ncbi:NAD-binding protein [Peniophora sp. CONT]|nr:NAD-binding protein [Peniophora sp. CONT]